MDYESKAVITSIKATSRAAIKIKDNFYTAEYTEERTIPDVDGIDIELERNILWDEANNVVDSQVKQILETF